MGKGRPQGEGQEWLVAVHPYRSVLWEQWSWWLSGLPPARLEAGPHAGMESAWGKPSSPKTQGVCSRGNGSGCGFPPPPPPRRTGVVAPAPVELGTQWGEGPDRPRDAFTAPRAESGQKRRGFAPTRRWRVQGRGESGPLCLIKLEKSEDSAGGIEGKR